MTENYLKPDIVEEFDALEAARLSEELEDHVAEYGKEEEPDDIERG